eukprot:scaffold1056_cov564-Prasinococcus_capsulatus_cf.AAC.13
MHAHACKAAAAVVTAAAHGDPRGGGRSGGSPRAAARARLLRLRGLRTTRRCTLRSPDQSTAATRTSAMMMSWHTGVTRSATPPSRGTYGQATGVLVPGYRRCSGSHASKQSARLVATPRRRRRSDALVQGSAHQEAQFTEIPSGGGPNQESTENGGLPGENASLTEDQRIVKAFWGSIGMTATWTDRLVERVRPFGYACTARLLPVERGPKTKPTACSLLATAEQIRRQEATREILELSEEDSMRLTAMELAEHLCFAWRWKEPSIAQVERGTKEWIRMHILERRVCPFAAEMKPERLAIHVCTSTDEQEQLTELLKEGIKLMR